MKTIYKIKGYLNFKDFIMFFIESVTLTQKNYTIDSDVIRVSKDKFKTGIVRPDFSDFEIIDEGNAIRFGEYEAEVDGILKEKGSL